MTLCGLRSRSPVDKAQTLCWAIHVVGERFRIHGERFMEVTGCTTSSHFQRGGTSGSRIALAGFWCSLRNEFLDEGANRLPFVRRQLLACERMQLR